MVDEARVRIVGDASGVAPAVQLTKDQLAGLEGTLAALTASFGTLSADIKASMASGTASTAEMAAEMGVLEAETEREALSLKEMALSAREGVEAVVSMKEAMFGFGELLMAAFAVEEIKKAAEKMGEVAERTEHLSQILGVSTKEVQQLRGAAVATGIDFETLARGMTLMDRKFETAPESFRKLGIEVKTGATQMQVLEAVMNRFKGLEGGPEKAALAFQTMGRAGAQMIPFLNMGADGLAELNRKSEEYGVVSDDATKKGVALAESINESKLAWDGLGNTMTSAFAPMLKDIVDDFNTLAANITKSYNEGGGWKVVFEGIEGVLSTLKVLLTDVGDAFGGLFTSSNQKGSDWSANLKWYFNQVAENGTYLKVQFVSAIDQMIVNYHIFLAETLVWWSGVKTTYEQFLNWIDKIEAEVNLLGTVVQQALSLQWGKIAQTWDNGMAMIQNVVAARGAAIVREAQNFRIQAAKEMAAAGGVSADFSKWAMEQIVPAAGNKDGVKSLEAGEGGSGAPVDFSKDKKPKKEKAQSRMSEWEEQLSEQKLALKEEDEADNSFREMSKADEANYWKNILDTVKLSHDEMTSVKTKYYDASFAARKQDFDDHIATLKKELDAAKGNLPEMQKIGGQIVDAYKRAYGDRSKEAQDAERQIGDIMRRGADDQRKIQDDLFKHIEDMQLKRIDEAQKDAALQNQLGIISAQRLLQQEKDLENRRYKIEADGIAQRKALIDPARDPAAFAKINQQIETLDQAHQAKLMQIDRKAVLERTALERQAITSTAQLWGQNIAKLITLQQGFAATIRSLYTGMVGIVSDALAQIIEKWLVQHLTALLVSKAASKADSADKVAMAAGVAGANAVASFAMAPWPIDMGAPAFGASMAATALSLGSAAAFDVGAYDLSSDGIGMLHKGETIIPADQASGWRNVMGLFASMPKFGVPSVGFGSGANTNAPIAANDQTGGSGGFHYHDHTARGLTPSQIMANRDAFAKAMKQAHREGKLGFSLPG